MKIISIPEVRDIHQARAKRRELLTRMAELEQRVANGDHASRPLLEADRETVAALEAFIEHEQERREARDRAESAGTGGSDPYEPPPADGRYGLTGAVDAPEPVGLARAIREAGWHLRERPSVRLEARHVFPAAGDLRPSTVGGVLPLGRDERFLWPLLRRQVVEPGQTAVRDFRQTGRTVTGTVERALDATSEKARLELAVVHVDEALRQLAILIPDVPNVVLESLDTAAEFFRTEATYQLNRALDAHVHSQIVAANPPQGATGADLVEQVRRAIAAMRAAGARPTILVLNPNDAAALDLLKQPGTADYMFPTRQAGAASPLWGLAVVERAEPADAPPVLIDPDRLGRLHLGDIQFLADPFSGIAVNTTNLRFEMNALFVVRDATAAYIVASD